MKRYGNTKYLNKKTAEFDSVKEERRYYELLLLEKAGEITRLQRQASFELIPTQYDGQGKLVERSCVYKADFTYLDNKGEQVVEDVKSAYTRKLPDYVIKRKLMLYRYGIRIKEVL